MRSSLRKISNDNNMTHHSHAADVIAVVPAAGVGVVVLANDLRSVDRVGLDLLKALSG